jgi:multicomponent Na+:H+ antiporter subunit F
MMTDLPPAVLQITMAVLILSMALTLIRLVRGPGLFNRVVALDLITSISAGIILVYAIMTGQPAYIDVAVIIFLISFLGTVAISRYLTKTE